MTTINTVDDLLRITRENEEFRAALRRELLTEELLATPAQVSHLLTTQTAMLEDLRGLRQDFNVMQEDLVSLRQDFNVMQKDLVSLRQGFNVMQEDLVSLRQDFNVMQKDLVSLRQDFNVMQEDLVSLRQETNALRHTQNTMLDTMGEIVVRLDRQHAMYRRQHEDLGRFRGNYAIDAARNSDVEISQLLARQRGMGRIQARPLSREELDHMLNENYDVVDALGLRERAWYTFPKADIIAEVTDRRNSVPGFFIAMEASYTANTEDVLRATDHARIIRCVTGLDAYAIVAGVRMAPGIKGAVFDEVAQFINTRTEDAALWFQIDEDELEPFDPY